MQIARYWSKVEFTAETPRGKSMPFLIWRGSPTSKADADRLAYHAAEQMAERIARGEGFPERYAYPDRPVREELVREIRDERGGLNAAITRNVYGALVLNAAGLLFIDVDLNPPAAPPRNLLSAVIRLLFGAGRPSSADRDVEIRREAEAHARRQQWLTNQPRWGMRVYRTRSGLRYLVTHALFEPGDAASEEAMTFLGCDPAYLLLCRSQRSFRARLTPKPWRCGVSRPPVRFPFPSAEEEGAMRGWQEEYNAASGAYATCALLETCGSPQIHPQAAFLLQIHDEQTRANVDLPLA